MTQLSPQPMLEEAIRLHRGGQLADAERLFRHILAAYPDHVESLQRLGILLHQSGRSDQAISLLARAVELSPGSADSRANLGAVLASRGMLDQAIQTFGAAIQLRPDVPQLHFNLANALRQSGRLDEAAKALRDALSLREDWPEAWNQLGGVLWAQNRGDEAIEAYDRAIALRPTWAEAYNDLAVVHHRRGEIEPALAAYRRAVSLAPASAETHNNLSAALQESGALEEALAQVEIAASLKPSDPGIRLNLGNALRNLGRPHEAADSYRKAISLRSDFAEAHCNLGSALRDLQRLDEAIASYQRAIDLRPNYGEAYGNLAMVLRDAGELDESIAMYRKAAEVADLPRVAGNLLYTLHFHPDYDAQRIFQEHVSWNDRYAKPVEGVALSRPARPIETHGRRLRVGYISCDFRNHPVGRFIQPLLAHHDRTKFEVYCYSDLLRGDALTDVLRSYADGWRNTAGLSDERFAELVRRDGIDILVDLTLHARTGRMLALATKPAPIQVSYLAYCSTSGLRTMDYRLSDPCLDPPDSDLGVYFEKTIRLKSYWCYPGAPFDLPVAPLPARAAGHVTFASLNVFAKVTKPTLLAWFEILRRVAGSRLMIHAMEGDHRNRMKSFAAMQGVDPNRIEFVGFLPGVRYFELYNQVDIALDPFPYAGGTTSCDAMWMGVPIVSLAGTTAVSRGGFSLLSTIGLSRYVRSEPAGYIETAATLAADLDELEKVRSTLRQKMLSSALMDGKSFALDVEMAYLQMVLERTCGLKPQST